MRGRKPEGIVAGSSPVADLPKPPTWLSKAAKAEWRHAGPILISERRTLTLADLATFAHYCATVGMAADAARVVTAEGMIVPGTGLPKRHPAVQIQLDAMKEARLLAGELGLTPVSRSRPAIRDDDASAELSFLD